MTVEKNAGKRLLSADDIEALVRGFEDCSLASSEFKHREHLLVAQAYLVSLQNVEAACTRMRAGLLRYLAHHGENPQLYNETVTLFWLRRVRAFLDAQEKVEEGGAHRSFDVADKMLERCGQSSTIYLYYSKELLATEEARQGWIEPDVQPLDF